MNKTALFCRFVNRLGLVRSLAWWRKHRNRTCFLIAAYHRILTAPADFGFDANVLSATPEEFEREIRFIQRYFRVISFAELKDILASSAPPPPNVLLLTFDDGYRDNFEHAYPILRRYQVPATVFVAAGYIDTGRTPWWDEVNYLLKKTPQTSLHLESLPSWRFEGGARAAAIEALLATLKKLPQPQVEEVLAELRLRSEVAIPLELSRDLMATWAQLREMSQQGIEIGAHSLTHPVLANVPTEEQLRREVAEPRALIERQIGQPVRTFAYPVGGPEHFDARVVAQVRACGYDFAVSYVHGVNPWDQPERWALRRIKTEVYNDFDRFRAKLTFPHWIRY